MTYGLTPRQKEQCTGRVLRQWAAGMDTQEIAEREVIPEHEVYSIVSSRRRSIAIIETGERR